MVQPERMLISSFHLNNGTLITPLLLFYLKHGLVCKKIHPFVQYIPKKCFNTVVQSAVNARHQGDENPNLSLVAETMKLLANSSYGSQMIDRSRHTVTKYLNDEKRTVQKIAKCSSVLITLLINCTKLNWLKPGIAHIEPIFVRLFILQYAKQERLELYFKFSI